MVGRHRVVVALLSLLVALSIILGPPFPVHPLKVLVVSINTGSDSQEYERALQNHKSYARCHGYDFLNAAQTAAMKSVHPYMQKAFALQQIVYREVRSFIKYDFILWIDRDAIFMDHTVSIPKRLNELSTKEGVDTTGADVFVAVEGWAWLNTGVLLFRNTGASRQIVDDWINTYESREKNYQSNEEVLIGNVPKKFRDLFNHKWSCEDQGAFIALLAGYNQDKKWNTDRFDGLGVPHVLHEGHAEWAAVSTDRILDPKYRSLVKIVAQPWLNTNPWDHETYRKDQKKLRRKSIDPFIFHFNGQSNKPTLIEQQLKKVKQCSKSW